MAVAVAVLDVETKRKLSELLDLMDGGVSIFWETLEDLGVFELFDHLPRRREELLRLLRGERGTARR